MSERLQEIRQYAEAELANPDYNGPVHIASARRHARFELELLGHIDELERENERLQQACTNYAQRLAVRPKTKPATGGNFA